MKLLEIVPMTTLGGRNMKKTLLRSGWALALVAGLLTPGLAVAQENDVPALHDGVVVDTASGTAYVMSPQGGIDAVDLASGNVVWKSQAAAKPLLVANGTLVAQATPSQPGEMDVVLIDSKQGNEKERKKVKVPPATRANVVDGPTASFRAQAFATTGGDVVITWESQDGRSLQGVLPPTVEAPQAGDAKSATASLRAVPNEPVRGAARLSKGQVVSMKFEEAKSLKKAPVTKAPVAAKSAAVAAAARQLVSLDGKHVLHSTAAPEGGLWMPYRWTVTDAAGVTVGLVDAPISMAPFVVAGSKVLFVAQPSARKEGDKMIEQPLRLVALDLQTGAAMWAVPVVDVNYRGPLAP